MFFGIIYNDSYIALDTPVSAGSKEHPMGTMVLSPAERTRAHNRKERHGARRQIIAGLEEYFEEREESAQFSDRELLLMGIYPMSMEQMSSSTEFWIVIGALGLLTPFEQSVASDTAHYLDWMKMMMEIWDQDLANQPSPEPQHDIVVA